MSRRQRDVEPSAPKPRSRRLRRWLALLLLLIVIAAAAGIVFVRANLETWVWNGVQQRLASTAELRAEVGEFRIRLRDLAVEFSGLRVVPIDPDADGLEIEVAYGRVRLPWRAVLGLGRRRVHLAELRLVRPRVRTNESLFHASREGRPAAEHVPIDLFIDRAEIVSGSWFHERTEKELELSATDFDLVGDWAGDRRTMLGELGLNLRIHGDPLERDATFRIDSTFRWRGREFELIRVHAEGAGLALDADVSVALDREPVLSGQGSFTADVSEIDGYMQASFPEIGGRAEGTVEFSLGPTPLKIEGDLDVRSAQIENFRAQRALAHVTYVPGRVSFRSIEATAFGGSGSGFVEVELASPTAVIIEASARDVDVARLIDWLKVPVPVSGKADGELHLRGRAGGPAAWAGEGTFVARPLIGDPNRVPVGGRGRFALADGSLELQVEHGQVPAATFTLGLIAEIDAVRPGGELTIEGRTDDARRLQLDVARFLDRLEIALPELLVQPLDGSGDFRARTRFGDPFDLDLRLGLERGAFAGQRFDRMQIDVGLGPDELTLRRVEIVEEGRSILGTASFEREPFRLESIDVHARRLDVAALLPLVNLETDLQGELSGRVQATTVDGGLRGAGELSLSAGRWLGEPFEEISADVRVEADRFFFEHLVLSSTALHAQGSATVDQRALKGTLRIDSAVLELEGISRIRGVAARVSTTGTLSFEEAGVSGRLEVRGEGLRVAGLALGDFGGSVDLVPAQVTAELAGDGEARWEASGTLGWDEGLPLWAKLRMERTIIDFPAESEYAPWVGLTGEMELNAQLASPETLSVEGTLTGADLHLGPHRLDLSESARFTLQEGRFEAATIPLKGVDSEFVASVGFDLAAQKASGSAKGQVGLRLLSSLLPDVRATGVADVDLQAAGPLDGIEWSGSIVLEGGRLRYLGFPHTLEQIEMKVKLLQDEAAIEEFSALLGGGELQGRGRVQLGLSGSEAIHLEVLGSNVRVALPEGFEGVYDGRLTLAGELNDAVIGGQVTMLRGLYDEEFRLGGLMSGRTREYSTGGVSGPVGNLGLDILVRADGNVWVRNDTAEIENHFEFRLGGTLQRPELTGRLGMEEGGSFRFRDVAYRIRSGSLEFTDPAGFNPYVFVNATTKVSNYEISLRVEGTLDQLEYELSSTPSVSQQDVIALLTTGKTLQELTGNRTTSDAQFTGDLAASYFAGALTDRFEKQLQQALGLDVLQINPLLIQTADPTTRVTVGKRIRDDVTVILSADVRSTEDRLYQVEWRATNKMLVNVRRDVNGGTGTDVLYTDRYWWKKPTGAGVEAVPATVPREVEETQPETIKVGSVAVLGVEDSEGEALKKLLPLSTGDRFSRSQMFRGVEALRRHYVRKERLRARVLSRVRVDDQNAAIVDIVYEVEPGPAIQVRYEGLKKKEQRRLSSELERLWARSLFTEDLFADSVTRIRQDFQQRGFYAADVQYEVSGDEERQEVTFLVDRGRVVRVDRINIHGAVEVPEERIRRQMLTRPPSLFGKGTFNPAVLEDDLAAIRSLYLDLGFLDVQIESPRIRLNAAGDEVEISLYITEGPFYTIESLSFRGDLVASRDQLAEWCGMRAGDVFSDSELLEAEARLRRGLDGMGYPDAKVRGRVELSDQAVRLAFEFQSGARMKVAEVQISGNQVTKEHVIRKEVGLKPGDLISREKILRAQHRLYRLDVFRNVRIEYEKAPGGDDSGYVVRVRVEEDRPLNLTVGVGYNTESKFRFSFATSQDNVNGRARSFGFQGEVSDILKRIQFLGRTPRIFGASVPGLANILWERETREGFRVERRSTALRVDHRINERWRAFLRYNFQRIDLLDVSDPGEVLEEKLEDVILGDVGVGVFRSTLDSLILPTRGNYFNLGFRVFAKPFLSERSFVRAQVTEMHSWNLGHGTSFQTAVRIGIAPTFGATEIVPISERFFAGGDSTNRGFARDRLGPTLADVDPLEYDLPPDVDLNQPVGGSALFLLNQEFRFPLVRRLRLKGELFYDAGNVYLELSDFDPLDLRHTLGAGLRLETPVGPLRAEYGWKLDREPGESSGQFHFAIGTTF